jgi:hypothetical protein
MLVFKLLLTPLFVGLIGLADRRWGATVGGWLVGLPLTSAPVTFFIVLELGTTFAKPLAMGILMGLISQAIFCLTYAWLSFRVNWLFSWLIGWTAFGASTFAFEQFSVPLPLLFLGVIISLVLVLFLWPESRGQGVSAETPAWATLGRMLMATSFVLVLTSTANLLGPHLSGLLSPLPIFATVFAVFAHKLQGGRPARQILHGVVVSSFACAVFFLLVAACIEQWGMVATFSASMFVALLTQGSMLWLLRRHTPPAQRKADEEDDGGVVEEQRFWQKNQLG